MTGLDVLKPQVAANPVPAPLWSEANITPL